MTLLHPKISEIYAIGTIIEANIPPSAKWLPCQGQILAQANYPVLYAMMDNPYSMIFSDWEFCDDYDTGETILIVKGLHGMKVLDLQYG